jgi:SAM-dependent methyltransferase
MEGLIEEADMTRVAEELGVYPRIHRDDFIFRFHTEIPGVTRSHAIEAYFRDGRASAQRLAALLEQFQGGRQDSRRGSILEFASGYGCVSRHLQKLPGWRIVACDIHAEAIRFAREELHLEAVLSNRDPGNLQLAEEYDVVFALSFFSHMPPRTWFRWARRLFECVKDDGVFIFTTHGPRVLQHWGNPAPHPDGYYFWSASEQKDLPLEDYGNIMVTPYYVFEQMRKIVGTVPILFQEAFWWGTQDTFIFGKNTRLTGARSVVPAPR